MGGNWRRTYERELGVQPAPELAFRASWGHRPLAWERGWTSDAAMVRRLAPSGELPAGAGGIHSVAWSPDGALLASGGEDCRVLVWDAHEQRRTHSLDLVRCSAVTLDPPACMHCCQKCQCRCIACIMRHTGVRA